MLWALCLVLIAFMLKNPHIFSPAIADALGYCLTALVPALLPFIVVGGLLCDTGFIAFIGRAVGRPIGKIFGVGPAAAAVFVLSLFAGPPTGARCAASLYASGHISHGEAERILAVSSGVSPAYLIAGVGMSLYGDMRFGVTVWTAQILAAVVFGAASRRIGRCEVTRYADDSTDTDLLASFASSLVKGGQAMLTICTTVVFFSALGTLCTLVMPGAAMYICPMLELSSGLSEAIPAGLPRGFAAAMCGFSGFAMIMQSALEAKTAGLSPMRLVLCRAFCAIVCGIAVRWLL